MIQSNTVLSDDYGRYMRKLRVSLLDACNLRCFYCMPENPKFMKSSLYLNPEQIEVICSELVDLGIEQVRLTGGEPTLRPDFDDIVLRLSRLKLKTFGMTTNAVFLDKKLELLKSAGCININISLDSLNEDKFNQITRRPVFKKVYAAILKARDMGFNVKINAVLMKGLNDSEVFDFLEFSKNETIEVRFLEMMRIGEACKNQTDYYISAQEIKERIEQKEKLFPQSVDKDSTSVKYITERGAQIGFIAPESKAFCHSCSRLRLSATGVLRACLMSKQGRNLRGVSLNNIPGVVREVIALKPINKVLQIDEFMNEIGG